MFTRRRRSARQESRRQHRRRTKLPPRLPLSWRARRVGAPPGRGTNTERCEAGQHAEERAMILLAYDGSPDAQAALDGAARLLPGADVTVLTVWESFPGATSGGLMGMGSAYLDPIEVDHASREAAGRLAAEGADRAAAAGLKARACTGRSITGAAAA